MQGTTGQQEDDSGVLDEDVASPNDTTTRIFIRDEDKSASLTTSRSKLPIDAANTDTTTTPLATEVEEQPGVIRFEELIIQLARRKHRNPAYINEKEFEREERFALARDFAVSALLEKMIETGHRPSVKVLEVALSLAMHAGNDDHVERLVGLFKSYWIPLSRGAMQIVTEHYCKTRAPEQCIAFLEGQLRAGQTIPTESWNSLVMTLLKLGDMDIVLEILQRVDGLKDQAKLEAGLLYYALAAFADSYHMNGLQWIWNQISMHGSMLNLDEGVCTKSLNVCGRLGLPILATDIMTVMGDAGMMIKNHHYTALIESYCVAGDVKNAFLILSIMRKAGVAPTPTTAAAILKFMSKDIDLIDRAFFTLQDLKEGGIAIDVSAFNAVIDACAVRKDVSRAAATFQEHKTLDIKPDIATLNSLVAACIGTYQKDLALSMIKLFREELDVRADAETYTRLISLCLLQDDYEDAFAYLEEMKDEGHQPAPGLYTLIVRRCLSLGDARASIAFDEMKGWGYRTEQAQRLFNARPADLSITAASTGAFEHYNTMTDSHRWFEPRTGR